MDNEPANPKTMHITKLVYAYPRWLLIWTGNFAWGTSLYTPRRNCRGACGGWRFPLTIRLPVLVKDVRLVSLKPPT